MKILEQLFEDLRVIMGDPLADDMGGSPALVHDWRTHVPYDIRQIWHTLSKETRLAVAICSEYAAAAEIWD